MSNKIYVLTKEIVKNNKFDSKLNKVKLFEKYNDAFSQMGKEYYETCDAINISKEEFLDKNIIGEFDAKIKSLNMGDDEFTILWTIAEGSL